MANLRVTITEPGGTSRTADVPDDQPMNRLVPALVTKMNLQAGTYQLMSKGLGRTLADTDTLASAGVQANDTLRLTPNVQGAGAR